jgi:proliferating cell nuclear antigen
MIYGTLSKTSTFKKITEVLATSDVVLIFDQKGMTCQGMDSSHVSMTFLNLDNRDFQEYTCNTQHRIPLNVLNLSKVIKCAGNDDAMIIRYVDGEDFITLMFKNAERVLQFSLNLVVIEQDEVEIPDM